MWNYVIDEKRRLVITTAWDVLTNADVLEHREQLKSDTRFNSNFFQLVDFTQVTGIALDHVAVRALTHEHMFSREARRAFVALSPLAWGMSRMFITLREVSGGEEQMGVFKTHDEALRWLFAGLKEIG